MTIRRRTSAIAIVAVVLVAWLGWRSAGTKAVTPAPPMNGDASVDGSLDARSIDDLVALARLYGYVRFFHPSDEAQLVDWDSLAIAAVEGAKIVRPDIDSNNCHSYQ